MGRWIDADADYVRCKHYVLRGYSPKAIHAVYVRWYGDRSPSLSTITRWRLKILQDAAASGSKAAVVGKYMEKGCKSGKVGDL